MSTTPFLHTLRLILRHWEISDAEDLFKWASDKNIGPIAGWPVHRSVEESRKVIEEVFCASECYAICLRRQSECLENKNGTKTPIVSPKSKNKIARSDNALPSIQESTPIGCIELKLNGSSDLTTRDDECELGFWIARPFWGQGLVPEASRELLRRAFDELNKSTVWCAYYDGNEKSRRAQEKIGFAFHHTCDKSPVPLLGETRIAHINYMTHERWLAINGK